MNQFMTSCLLLSGLTLLSGCTDEGFGGGAYQATTVTVLPADLRGGPSEADDSVESASGSPSASIGPGTFAGRVIMSGGAPTLAPLIAQGADVKDKETCSVVAVPDERLVIGADNGVANVFISIVKAPKGTPKPETSDEAVIFDQKGCRFLPHCLLVPVGQTVKVLSGDGVSHNTHSYPARNNGVNQSVDPNDRDGKLQFAYRSSEKQPLKVACDFHSWMIAYHLPVDHPYAALTDADGNFEIKDIPAGDHVFWVWHEAAKGKFVERKLKVTIKAGDTTQQNIDYPAASLDL